MGRQLSRMRRTPPSIGVVVVVAGGLGAVHALTTAPPATPVEAAAVPVRVEPVAWERSVEVATRYLGEVQARQRVDLSFELVGTIESITVDEGETVEAGAVVASLDTSRLRADIERLDASVSAVRSDLELSRLTLSRTERAAERNAATDQELDRAASAVRVLEARLAEAEAATARTKVDLEKSVVRAPFEAIVTRRGADEGSLAQPGTAVVSLLERSRPEVRVGVAPSVLDAVGGVGGAHTVTVRGRRYAAEVIRVLPTIDRATRTAEVRLGLAQPLGERLRDGDAAELELVTRLEAEGFWVPMSALTQSVRGLWALYIATPKGSDVWTLERREVEVVRPESGRAFVRGGVDGGELVVVDGKQRLTPGLSVRPVDDAAGGE